jgi:ubiquinone/menaquinone biosynthesis C-methylase UbiE
MNETVTYINEKKAEKAFSEQSKIFDELYSRNKIVQYKRERVRSHVKKYHTPGSFILDLNSGTGEDAVWFAKEGHKVHATDISTGMMEKLKEKINTYHLQSQVSHEVISFTELNLLFNKGPYDLIFSNFAGLNCTNELNKVLRSFSSLLKPNGVVTLVILSKFCLCESLILFK